MAPSASLVVIKRSGGDGQRYVLDDRHWCTIGSHPECDIIIHSKGVAKLHALVRVTDIPTGASSVFGLDQQLPTVVPGKKAALYKDDGASLEVGDRFYVGERAFRFEISAAEPLRILAETTTTRASSEGNVVVSGRDAFLTNAADATAVTSHHKERRRRRSSLVVKDASEEFVSAAKTQSLLTARRLSLSAERVVSDFFNDETCDTEPASNLKNAQCHKPPMSKPAKSPLTDLQQIPVSTISRRMLFENAGDAHGAVLTESENVAPKAVNAESSGATDTAPPEGHGSLLADQKSAPSRISTAASQATSRPFRTSRPSQIPSTLRKTTFASAARSKPQSARNSPYLAKRTNMTLVRREPASVMSDSSKQDPTEISPKSEGNPEKFREDDTDRLYTPKRVALLQPRTEFRPPKRARIESGSRTAPKSTTFRTLGNAHLQSANLPTTLASPRRLNFMHALDTEELNSARLLTPKRIQHNEPSSQTMVSSGTHRGSFHETPAPLREYGPRTRSSSDHETHKDSDFVTNPLAGQEQSETHLTMLSTPIHKNLVPGNDTESLRPFGPGTCLVLPDASPVLLNSGAQSTLAKSPMIQVLTGESVEISRSKCSSLGSLRIPVSEEARLRRSSPPRKVESASPQRLKNVDNSAETELLFEGVKSTSITKGRGQESRALPPRTPKTDSHVRILRKRPMTPPKQILRRPEGGASTELRVRNGSGISKHGKHSRSRAGRTSLSQKTVLFADALGAEIELASGPHYSPHIRRSLNPELCASPVPRTREPVACPRFEDDVPNPPQLSQIKESQCPSSTNPHPYGGHGTTSRSSGDQVLPRPSPVVTETKRMADTTSVDSIMRALGPPPSTPLGRLGFFFYPICPRVPLITAPTPRKLIEGPSVLQESSGKEVALTPRASNSGCGDVSDSNNGATRRRSFSSLPGIASAMNLMRRFSVSTGVKEEDVATRGLKKLETDCMTLQSKTEGCTDAHILGDETKETLAQLETPGSEALKRGIADQTSEDTRDSSSENGETPVTASDPSTPRRRSLLGRAVSAVAAVASTPVHAVFGSTTPVHAVFGSRGGKKNMETSDSPPVSAAALTQDLIQSSIGDEPLLDSQKDGDKFAHHDYQGHVEAINEALSENDVEVVTRRIAEAGGDISSSKVALMTPIALSEPNNQGTKATGTFEKWTVKELREYLGGLGKGHNGLRKAELVKLAQSTVMVPKKHTERTIGEECSSPNVRFSVELELSVAELPERGSGRIQSTVESLRKQLEDLGLPTTGRKADLLERLELAHSAAESSQRSGQLEQPTLGVPYVSTMTGLAEDCPPMSASNPRAQDESLSFLTVRELRELLRERGFPTDGRKLELITRLHGAEEECRTPTKSGSERRLTRNNLENGEACSESNDNAAKLHARKPDLTLRTVVELRAELKRRGLATAGKKPDLISRLRDVL
jgi:SAP domain